MKVRRASSQLVLMALLLVLGTLSACSDASETSPSPPPAPWRVLDVDSRGAIITDGKKTIGVDSAGRHLWEEHRRINGAACISECPTAALSDGGGRLLERGIGARDYKTPVTRISRVLDSRKTDLLAVGRGSKPVLLNLRRGLRQPILRLSGSTGLWFPNAEGDMGVYLDTGRANQPIAAVVAWTPKGWGVLATEASTEAYGCIETSLSERLPGEMAWSEYSSCAVTSDVLVVAKTWAEISTNTDAVRYMADLHAIRDGAPGWSASCEGFSDVKVSSHGVLGLACGSGVRLIDARTGEVVRTHTDASGVAFDERGRPVTVSSSGEVRWQPALRPGSPAETDGCRLRMLPIGRSFDRCLGKT